MTKPFLDVLQNKKIPERPVWWLMRQAGRYLPEYREVRAQGNSFLDLVYHPERAAEVTLQPIRRYGMDAAILFSDILVIPHALGMNVRFVEGEGPKLDPVTDAELLSFANFEATLSPVYETLRTIHGQMQSEGILNKTVIGFAGAPWTVACYMLEGGGSKEFAKVKKFAYQNEEEFGAIINVLVEATTDYLLGQVRAGAEALQIFDSWAGVLDETAFRKWVIHPTKKIIEQIRGEYPDIPIIGFPKSVGNLYVPYVQQTGVTGVSLDQGVSTSWAAGVLQPHSVVQGNLDPIRLMAGGDSLIMSVEKIVSDLSGGPFIFNLGHGIHKDTPPENVELLKNILYNSL